MYRVLLHNDDYTIARSSSEVLRGVFRHSAGDAVRIIASRPLQRARWREVFTREIAETKVTPSSSWRATGIRCASP
ncbi:MAG: ATP-dependent Clp protease adaptor ClpS [Sandaracinaceae bacterium]